MLKTVFKQTTKVLKDKLSKSKVKELLKHPNYIEKAKEIWAMINKDLGISDTIENKIISKADKFEKALLAKFPELTKDDATEIRQSIIGESNISSEYENAIKQLQEENEKLKKQLSELQSLDSENVAKISNEIEKANTVDVKQENIEV